jgi:hypothetical protein
MTVNNPPAPADQQAPAPQWDPGSTEPGSPQRGPGNTMTATSITGQIALAISDPSAVVPRSTGETDGAWSARAVTTLLADALAVRPCHITGMHEPDHHTRYQCSDQKAAALDGLLDGLGLTFADLPRRLHDETCGWCHTVPSQERYRERLRATHRWAGEGIPPALAEPAPDALRPGDTEVVLAHVTGEWRHWPDVFAEVQAATAWPAGRIGAAIDTLEKAGAVETQQHGRGVRRSTEEPSADSGEQAGG